MPPLWYPARHYKDQTFTQVCIHTWPLNDINEPLFMTLNAKECFLSGRYDEVTNRKLHDRTVPVQVSVDFSREEVQVMLGNGMLICRGNLISHKVLKTTVIWHFPKDGLCSHVFYRDDVTCSERHSLSRFLIGWATIWTWKLFSDYGSALSPLSSRWNDLSSGQSECEHRQGKSI